MPKVSVIMAVYNIGNESILKQSILSVLRQTFRDFEFLICDDGSTDHTYQILRKYAAMDRRIQIIRCRTNHKAGYARNVCIQKAKGRYLAVMDADDSSAPVRIEKQVRFLEKYQQYDFVGTKGEFFVRYPGDDGENYWYCKSPGPKDFLFSFPFVHASLMFRREAIERVHGYHTSRWVVRVEDYDLLLRCYIEGMRGFNLNEVLYYCRRDAEQYKRRKYRYRFHEVYVRFCGFRQLGMLPKAFPYVIKPLIVGIIPSPFMKRIQKRFYSAKQGGQI